MPLSGVRAHRRRRHADPVCMLSPDRAMIDAAIGEPPDVREYRYRTLATEPQRA